MAFDEVRMGGVGGKVRYKYGLGRHSYSHFFLTLFSLDFSQLSFSLPALVPVELIFSSEIRGLGRGR